MSQNNDPLIYRQEGEIGFIEINRPEKKNALNNECWQLFDKYCDELNAAKQIRQYPSRPLYRISHVHPDARPIYGRVLLEADRVCGGASLYQPLFQR